MHTYLNLVIITQECAAQSEDYVHFCMLKSLAQVSTVRHFHLAWFDTIIYNPILVMRMCWVVPDEHETHQCTWQKFSGKEYVNHSSAYCPHL